jgi:hypothetical protein
MLNRVRHAFVMPLALTISVAVAVSAVEPVAEKSTAVQPNGEQRIPVDEARLQARLMHKMYAATLETMHHHYFHGARAIVPARAMEDVFAEMARESNIEARWIAVNTKAMSVGHEPASAFEKQAAKELAEGKEAVEQVEEGYYRRAGAIPLAADCVSCHTGFFNTPPKTPRFAGLVISIPVVEN